MNPHSDPENRSRYEGEPRTNPAAEGAPGSPGPEAEGPVSGAVPAGKADLVKRFVAALIDGVVGFVIGIVPYIGGIVAGAYWLFRDGFEFDFMHRRSLGKKVMKLRPVSLDGTPVDLVTSAKRNWMFALGGVVSLLIYLPIVGWLLIVPVALAALALGVVELVLVITDGEGIRLGDRIARTKVIEAE